MQKKRYTKSIHAPADTAYRTMLGLDDISTYQKWTKLFNPTSTYEGSWDKGSKIRFIGTDEEDNRGGMVSEIADHISNEFVAIRHTGVLKDDEVVTEGSEIEKWAGRHENYYLKEYNGSTTVTVETDVSADYLDYFNETRPKALDKLKSIAEGNG